MLIPIKQNVEDRTDTWKGYIRVEKAERHYFLIDGDDVMTLQWRESSMRRSRYEGCRDKDECIGDVESSRQHERECLSKSLVEYIDGIWRNQRR